MQDTLDQSFPRFTPASDQSLLVSLGEQITMESHRRVVGLLRLLEREPISGVRNLHPAYCSLLVVFDGLRMRHADLENVLRSYLGRIETMPQPEPRLVDVPICYDPVFGLDIRDVASECSLSVEQVAEMHSSVIYAVYFLGFLPGFAYLGELSERLALPRLASPRRLVPPGSVGIAGRQTGVYPFASPGGWRILGRTPLAMFRHNRPAMSLLSIGDRVRFVSISRGQFDAAEQA